MPADGQRDLYATGSAGLLDILRHYYEDTSSNNIREWVEAYMNALPCPECKGGRLKKENLAVMIEDADAERTIRNPGRCGAFDHRRARRSSAALSLPARQTAHRSAHSQGDQAKA